MKQIKSNSFKDIVNADLEHVVFGVPDYDERNRPVEPPTVDHLKDLLDYNFTKKQNLIYQNDSFYNLCDFIDTKKQNTECASYDKYVDQFLQDTDRAEDDVGLCLHEPCTPPFEFSSLLS